MFTIQAQEGLARAGVLLTRHGRPINAMNADLWQPISNLSLQSWADFSSRLPEGQASLSWRWGGGGG